jgi:glucose/arabinose dehydrogenase
MRGNYKVQPMEAKPVRTIDDELLEPAVMAQARAALIAKYPWFKHIPEVQSITSIRNTGLTPPLEKAPYKPSGPPEDILTGFVSESGEAWGRPVGVVVDKSGALLVADDVGNVVWRVSRS